MNRRPRILFGALAVAALAAGVAGCGADNDEAMTLDGTGGLPSASESFTVNDSAAAPAGTQVAALPPQSAGGSEGSPALALPAQLDRKIVYNATINLQVGDVGTAFSDASSIARVAGGYVEKSSFSGSDGTNSKDRGATLTIRVPAAAYEDTLAKLRGLPGAKVMREGAKSSEVTEQYTDLESRLRVLQSTEQSYLKLLEQAKSIPDILTLTDRLNGVRSQIEQVQGRINVLDHLTELASIELSLAPLAAPASVRDGPKGVGDSFADAWVASLEGARYVASAAAVLAVGAFWLAIPAGLALLGLRLTRRRLPRPARTE